jgi:hypothetical protein
VFIPNGKQTGGRVHKTPASWPLCRRMAQSGRRFVSLPSAWPRCWGRIWEAVASRLAAAGRDGGWLQVLTDEIRLQGQPEAAVLLVLDEMEELLGLERGPGLRPVP